MPHRERAAPTSRASGRLSFNHPSIVPWMYFDSSSFPTRPSYEPMPAAECSRMAAGYVRIHEERRNRSRLPPKRVQPMVFNQEKRPHRTIHQATIGSRYPSATGSDIGTSNLIRLAVVSRLDTDASAPTLAMRHTR